MSFGFGTAADFENAVNITLGGITNWHLAVGHALDLIENVGGADNRPTLLYAGPIDGVQSFQLASDIANRSNGQIRIIDDMRNAVAAREFLL